MYIVIMGGGKVGEYLASVLLDKGHEVAVLESDRDTADHLSVELQGEYLIINGDGCDSDFQEDAGIRKADVFVAVTGRDDDNLVACEIATRVFNVNRCIARVNNPKNRRIFREVGIESVSSTMLIANMIEEEALMGGVGVVSALSRCSRSRFHRSFATSRWMTACPSTLSICPKAACSSLLTAANTARLKWRPTTWCSIRAIRPSWSPSTISSTMFARYSALCRARLGCSFWFALGDWCGLGHLRGLHTR